MASLPFVDTHVHFWDLTHPSLRWVWLEPEFIHPILGNIDAMKSRRYLAEDFLAETRFQNVSKCVHVQAALGSADPVEETRWLQEQADRLGAPHGIVAEAPLARADVADVLDAQASFANVRGIRDFGQGDYLADPAWQRGYGLLGERQLICCLDSEPDLYPKARALAELHPQTVLCLDHAGFPRRRDPDYFAHWSRNLRDLAQAPSTIIKISGLGMCDPQWTDASWKPWVETCIDAFGVDRVVLGSNWAVDRLFSSYGDILDAYDRLLAGYTEAERVAMFSANAERIFRI